MKYILILLTLVFVTTVQAKESIEFANRVVLEHGLASDRANRLRDILTKTPEITRNIATEDPNEIHGPNNSWHMASRAQCIKKLINTGLLRQDPASERVCGAKWMSLIPGTQICIDQFEFPDLPCEYPIVWTTSETANQICQAMGKRACNSHEWEGACAGKMETQNPYHFELSSLDERRAVHNREREKVWAFSWNPKYANIQDHRALCGIYDPQDPELASPMRSNPSQYYTNIGKSLACQKGPGNDWQTCGTNTWPSGFKFECRTQNNIFDLHGNTAEVTSFPTSQANIAHGTVTGKTERKGAFFVDRPEYPDDCRVRQPYEHFQDFATGNMAYYQEGFRCCKDIE